MGQNDQGQIIIDSHDFSIFTENEDWSHMKQSSWKNFKQSELQFGRKTQFSLYQGLSKLFFRKHTL